MPFHLGGHKPRSTPKHVVTIWDRLGVTLAGSILIVAGVYRIWRGAEYVINEWGLPVYAYGYIIAGVIVIPLAWFPTRWMEKAVGWAVRVLR